jgi:Na+-driven multidrug efflux pump
VAGENTKEMKENKMGYLPESRLILTMSVPMMLSMMVQALYNVVDSLFVSRISEAALTDTYDVCPHDAVDDGAGTLQCC